MREELRSRGKGIRFSFLVGFLSSFCFLAHAAQDDVVNFWHVGNYDDVVVMRELAAIFEKQTGIRVHIQPVPWGDFNTKYLTAMAAGTPPDAGSTNLSGAMEYGKVGGLVDLGQRFPDAVERLKGLIFPKMWPICYFRGRLLGVPLDAAALVGFYRKDVFDSLGLKPPETWPQLDHVLDVITARGYDYAFVWTRNSHWAIGTFTWPFGQDSFSDGGLKVNWLDPGFLKGYRYAIDIWNRYNSLWEKPVEMFMLEDPARASPMFIDLHFRYTEILTRAPQMRGKFGLFPFPRPDDGEAATIMGGRVMVIFREGKHPEEAMKWIEFILSKESQVYLYKACANLGERSGLMLSINREFWNDDLGLLPGCQAALHDVYERMNTREAYPWLGEASLPLERSMYEMQDLIQQLFKQMASKRGISVFDFKKAMASGEFPEELQAYKEFLNANS